MKFYIFLKQNKLMKIKILCIGECKNELTLQEFKVLKLASEGLSNKEISELLFIGESTIKSHRRNIMQKLGIKGKIAMNKFLRTLNYQSPT